MREKKRHNPPNQARHFRIEMGLKQCEIAFLLDIKNVGRISEWENGISNPSIEHLIMLSLIYQQLESQIYYGLRKELAAKLEKRKKLLKEMKRQCKDSDKGG